MNWKAILKEKFKKSGKRFNPLNRSAIIFWLILLNNANDIGDGNWCIQPIQQLKQQ